MKKNIEIEMEQPNECNVCPFIDILEDYTYECILTSKDIEDIVGKVDCDCPFKRILV